MKSKIGETQYVVYLELYDYLSEKSVGDEEFLWSVEQLREYAAERATGDAIAESMEILKKGKELKSGTFIKGHEEARSALIERFSTIDRDLHQSEAPEGVVQDEYEEIISDYNETKAKREAGETIGIGFGIEHLDQATGGMQRGELVLIAASTSHGKSSMAAQSAWYAATQQGKNVVFFATETGRVQTRRKLIARHSMLPDFNLPDGLNLRNLKEGSLTETEERVFKDVVHDLTHNTDYGKIHLAQVPRGSSILDLEHKIQRISRNFGVDFVVMDYLALLEATTRSIESERTKQVSTLREAKLVATTAADGLGVPFLSPWQINRDGRSSADTSGYYSFNDMADTSEAEKLSDVLITLFRNDEDTGRFAEGNLQILKARDGVRTRDLPITIDYATSTFTAKHGLSDITRSTGASSWNNITDGMY
jgi:replicative DNA helicase